MDGAASSAPDGSPRGRGFLLAFDLPTAAARDELLKKALGRAVFLSYTGTRSVRIRPARCALSACCQVAGVRPRVRLPLPNAYMSTAAAVALSAVGVDVTIESCEWSMLIDGCLTAQVARRWRENALAWAGGRRACTLSASGDPAPAGWTQKVLPPTGSCRP